jgi:hypothetical protein
MRLERLVGQKPEYLSQPVVASLLHTAVAYLDHPYREPFFPQLAAIARLPVAQQLAP